MKSFDPAGGVMVCYSQSHCTFEQWMSAFPYKSQRLRETHFTATLHPSCSAELSSASVHCIAMKDQLERYLLPTADLQKAIDRNAKQDKDLSLVAKQIDKEKRMTLNQLSRKQDAFKKQVLKRQQNLSKQFKVQLFQQGNVAGTDRPRLYEMETASRERRRWSCEETRRASTVHLPTLQNKRHSLPCPAFRSSDGDDFSLKTGSEIILPRRKEKAKAEDKSAKDDRAG